MKTIRINLYTWMKMDMFNKKHLRGLSAVPHWPKNYSKNIKVGSSTVTINMSCSLHYIM